MADDVLADLADHYVNYPLVGVSRVDAMDGSVQFGVQAGIHMLCQTWFTVPLLQPVVRIWFQQISAICKTRQNLSKPSVQTMMDCENKVLETCETINDHLSQFSKPDADDFVVLQQVLSKLHAAARLPTNFAMTTLQSVLLLVMYTTSHVSSAQSAQTASRTSKLVSPRRS